jgi:hypothetical protein
LENKIIGRESQGVCRQDKLIGGKPPGLNLAVVKLAIVQVTKLPL